LYFLETYDSFLKGCTTCLEALVISVLYVKFFPRGLEVNEVAFERYSIEGNDDSENDRSDDKKGKNRISRRHEDGVDVREKEAHGEDDVEDCGEEPPLSSTKMVHRAYDIIVSGIRTERAMTYASDTDAAGYFLHMRRLCFKAWRLIDGRGKDMVFKPSGANKPGGRPGSAPGKVLKNFHSWRVAGPDANHNEGEPEHVSSLESAIREREKQLGVF
jgi:hypothetical protein